MGIRRLGRCIRTCLLVGLGLFAATHVGVRYWTYNWPEPPLAEGADAIVCLGGDQRRDLTAGPASQIRVEACTALFEAGVAPIVLFTGAGPDARSSAQAMADYALSLGLPADAILLEERSRSTLQNAYYSLAMLPEDARIVAVTDTFHLPRSWGSFWAMGARDFTMYPAAFPVTGPGSGYREEGPPDRYLNREVKAIWFNALRFPVWWIAGVFGVPEDNRIHWLD